LPDEVLAEIFQKTKTIAIVGASTNPEKPAHSIPAYLQAQGYRIIPVNPTAREILGEPTVSSLAHIAVPVDVVDVFRPADEALGVAEQAINLGASALWLQSGIESAEAAELAADGGLTIVMDTCMGATHRRLVREGML
jgi:predicted CoA-binding protein